MEWFVFSDCAPVKKVPVLLFRPLYFEYDYSVCVYDGVSNWFIFGFAGCLSFFPAKPSDKWIYVSDYISKV